MDNQIEIFKIERQKSKQNQTERYNYELLHTYFPKCYDEDKVPDIWYNTRLKIDLPYTPVPSLSFLLTKYSAFNITFGSTEASLSQPSPCDHLLACMQAYIYRCHLHISMQD